MKAPTQPSLTMAPSRARRLPPAARAAEAMPPTTGRPGQRLSTTSNSSSTGKVNGAGPAPLNPPKQRADGEGERVGEQQKSRRLEGRGRRPPLDGDPAARGAGGGA